jgi:competence transcription factor ComK
MANAKTKLECIYIFRQYIAGFKQKEYIPMGIKYAVILLVIGDGADNCASS